MARIGPARFGALLLARVLLGLSAGLYTVSVPALIAEGLPSRKAEAYLATYPCGWPTGALLAILMASNHWRLALGLGPLIASMLLLPLLLRLPESPQWLGAKELTNIWADMYHISEPFSIGLLHPNWF